MGQSYGLVQINISELSLAEEAKQLAVLFNGRRARVGVSAATIRMPQAGSEPKDERLTVTWSDSVEPYPAHHPA